MKRIIRILVLAAALVTGLTTVSAQTVQVLVHPKVPTLPTTITSYLDDPFRYFNIQFIVTGAGSEGIDVFFDMDFTVDTHPFYVRTRQGTTPMQPIHLSEGVNPVKYEMLKSQLQNRLDINVNYTNPVNAQQLPEGIYELCVDFYLWSDKGRQNPITIGPCPTIEICYSASAPELVSPMAGAQMALNGAMVVIPSRRVNFFWTPVISNCSGRNAQYRYEFKVVKVVDGQNYQDAIKYNPTVFSAEARNTTLVVFDTLRDIKTPMKRGALYVAQVKAQQIKTNNKTESINIANNGESQPMPFFWDFPEDGSDEFLRGYIAAVEEEDESGRESKGVDGLTQWEGGIEEASELDNILSEALPDERTIVLVPKRHYVESDGYYTIPMTNDLEIGFMPIRHESLKNVSYQVALYDYINEGVDSITAQEPLFSELIEQVPEGSGLAQRTLAGWGAQLKQGSLYYLQFSSSFAVDYWKYQIADTCFYVNGLLAEHVHDTISRDLEKDELLTVTGVFFQWGDDPDAPSFTAPQWKAPVDRTGDDIYDPTNHKLPTSVPEVQKNKAFPVSWAPVKDMAQGDEAEYEVTVYELKPGQTLEEAISTNKVIVSRALTHANEITEEDTEFFKAFSPSKTYVMTLSTNIHGDSEVFYHFENGNEALPVVFKIVK